MPGRDGTGPMGQGAMSGRGLGACTGVNASGRGAGFGLGRNRGMGCGMGLGFGRKRGFGGNFQGTFPEITDKEILSRQKEFFRRKIESIDAQLENFSGSDK